MPWKKSPRFDTISAHTGLAPGAEPLKVSCRIPSFTPTLAGECERLALLQDESVHTASTSAMESNV